MNMVRLFRCGLCGFCLLLIAAAPGVGQPPAPNDQEPEAPGVVRYAGVDYACTPMSFTDLLPKEGIEGVNIAYWGIQETTYRDVDLHREGYWHTRIKAVGGKMIFEEYWGGFHENASVGYEKYVYRADGTLERVEHGSLSETQFDYSVGSVKGDELVRVYTRSIVKPDGSLDCVTGPRIRTEVQTRPMKEVNARLHDAWFELIIAYHLRAGNDNFYYNTGHVFWDYDDTDAFARFKWSESMWIDRAFVDVNVIEIAFPEMGGGKAGEEKEPVARRQSVFLDTGEFVKSLLETKDYRHSSRRASVEEIAERLGVDKSELEDFSYFDPRTRKRPSD